MKKDIEQPIIEDIAVAVVKEMNESNEEVWNVYLINLKEECVEQVLVSSKGYFTDENGNETKTSVLRHGLGDIEGKSFAKIEPIMEDVLTLHNEYWVSFFLDNKMYDKKYIFLAETISEKNFVNVPVINKKGVMIK